MVFTEAVAKLKNLALINASHRNIESEMSASAFKEMHVESNKKYTTTVQETISSESEKTSQQVQTNVIDQREMKMKQCSQVKN